MKKNLIPFLAASLFWGVPVVRAADGCAKCHGDTAFRVTNKRLYDYFQEWKGAPHDLAGVSCSDCHEGDSSAATKEAAHAGIQRPSQEGSPLYYKNIPDTCGKCHAPVYDHFVKSKHYQNLNKTGGGPNCVTCHGSMNAKTYYKTVIASACSNCHNADTQNHPEIPEQAREIINRLNHADGYRKWASFYYDSIGKPERMKSVDPLYQDIAYAWHSFDFKRLDTKSKKLVEELKDLFNMLKKERQEKEDRKK